MPTDTDFLYFPSAETAREELDRRQKDSGFRAFVDTLFGIKVPKPLQEGPRAIFSRPIASPTIEFCSFYEQAARTGLPAAVFEYTADKYVARNWEKYCLGKLIFAKECSGSYEKISAERIIDFNTYEGKPIVDIQTSDGMLLTDFHHALLRNHLDGKPVEQYDFSDWFIPSRGNDRWSYYLRYLGLFLAHGILFENFLLDKRERDFTMEVVMPAFRTITDVAGYAPIIVRAMPIETEQNSDYWCYYDESVRKHL